MTDTDFQHSSLPVEKQHRIRDMRSSGKLSNEQLRRIGIIHSSMDDTALLNVYRDLRSKLMRVARDSNFVCMVTAIAPDDTADRLTVNLGAAIAFDAFRSAVVIDCDTNANVLDELTIEQDRVGLTEFIEKDMDDVSVLINESGIDRLRVVHCGDASHTRTETLESRKMKEVVSELKGRYNDRFVFINAPSMKLSSEVQILANVCDMVLFQVTSGLVTQQQITDAVELIGADKVAGIVFRDV